VNGKRPPDGTRFAFVCAFGDWQVQAAPRARSDMGGAVDLFRAMCEAHRDHIFTEHTEAEREAMRAQLIRMSAPENITQRRGKDHAASFLTGVPLPRWWVDR
jgi:hypothetical protein